MPKPQSAATGKDYLYEFLVAGLTVAGSVGATGAEATGDAGSVEVKSFNNEGRGGAIKFKVGGGLGIELNPLRGRMSVTAGPAKVSAQAHSRGQKRTNKGESRKNRRGEQNERLAENGVSGRGSKGRAGGDK